MFVEIDREDDLPLHEQVEHSIREGIQAGRLAAGERLPSSRALARELGISRGVVTEAYGQLVAEGYLLSSQGAPVRVARTVRAAQARSGPDRRRGHSRRRARDGGGERGRGHPGAPVPQRRRAQPRAPRRPGPASG